MGVCAQPGCNEAIPPRVPGQKGRSPKFCKAHRQKRRAPRPAVPPSPRCVHGKLVGQCQMPECSPLAYLAGVVKGICGHLREGLETTRVPVVDRAFFEEQIAVWEHTAERFGGGE